MSVYERFIDEVVLRLAGTPEEPVNMGSLGYNVLKLEDHEGEYKDLKPNDPVRVCIALYQERFGTEQEPWSLLTGQSSTDRHILYIMTVSGRKKYGAEGVYDGMELAERLLLGFKPSMGGEVEIAGMEFRDFKNMTWHYQSILRHKRFPLIEIDNFRAEKPLFPGVITDIDFDEDFVGNDIVNNLGQKITVPIGENGEFAKLTEF